MMGLISPRDNYERAMYAMLGADLFDRLRRRADALNSTPAQIIREAVGAHLQPPRPPRRRIELPASLPRVQAVLYAQQYHRNEDATIVHRGDEL